MALAAGQPARRIDRDEIESLTRAHLPLVQKSVARVIGRLPRKPADDDLVAAAMMGLVQAAVAFDPGRNVAFGAFAALRVRGAVLDELRRSDWASRPVRARAKHLTAASERLTATLGRFPTEAELGADLDLSPSELQRLVNDVHRALVVSLSGDEDEAVASVGGDPLLTIIEQETHRHLAEAIRSLPDRYYRVVVGYFFDGLTMRELGAELGVTESRICQLAGEAVEMLRTAVGDPTGRVIALRRTRSR